MSFSPNGVFLAASNATIAGEPHMARPPSIWRLDDGTLERRACVLAGGKITRTQWHDWMRSIPFVASCGTSPGSK